MKPFEWIFGFQRFDVKLGLERIKFLMEAVENPQENYKVIHVGGTNGKGSVCKFIASVLHKAGYRVGLYTSPHLRRYSERIVVDGKEISEREIEEEIDEIRDAVEELMRKGDEPTFFEITTAIALDYFSKKNVDFAVIEVGLGGKLDATNVVNPAISIITNVSLDHSNYLGNSIEEIAMEKAGIIKGAPVITAANGKALDVIMRVAREKGADVSVVGNDAWRRLSFDTDSQTFLIKGKFRDYELKTKMLGSFQGENLAISIYAIEDLQMHGVYMSDDDIINGILETRNPGRMELLRKDPIILLDGAHNPSGMEALVKSLKDFDYERLILIIGILADKDIKGILSKIIPKADVVISTQPRNRRACSAYKLAKFIENFGKRAIVEPRVKESVKKALDIAGEKDLICVTGSLYTVGEALGNNDKNGNLF